MFMQVYNNTNQPHPAATSITITDTQDNSYTPIAPGEVNQYAYRAGTVARQKPDPAARHGRRRRSGRRALLLLYKIKIVSLDNRPLELKITDPENPAESASAELDV